MESLLVSNRYMFHKRHFKIKATLRLDVLGILAKPEEAKREVFFDSPNYIYKSLFNRTIKVLC